MMSGISPTAHVKRFIARLPSDAIFAARELLHIGNDPAVYKALSRLAKKGTIIRVSRGVYMKAYPGPAELPTPHAVAMVKAKAWGKRIMEPCANAAVALHLLDEEETSVVFSAAGCTTSFNTIAGRVLFKKTCPKKLLLGDGKVASRCKALWQMGKFYCERDENVFRLFEDIWINHFEREELISFAAILPGWLRRKVIRGEHFNALKWEKEKRRPIDRVSLTSYYLPGKELSQSA